MALTGMLHSPSIVIEKLTMLDIARDILDHIIDGPEADRTWQTYQMKWICMMRQTRRNGGETARNSVIIREHIVISTCRPLQNISIRFNPSMFNVQPHQWLSTTVNNTLDILMMLHLNDTPAWLICDGQMVFSYDWQTSGKSSTIRHHRGVRPC